MTTVLVTVNIPDGYELADTKMRPAQKGEFFIGAFGTLGKWDPPGASDRHYVILRPIQSEYVDVRVRRVIAEAFPLDYSQFSLQGEMIAAFKVALAAKPEPCGHNYNDTMVCLAPRGHSFSVEQVCGKPHRDGTVQGPIE
jgi:hypothetical protein